MYIIKNTNTGNYIRLSTSGEGHPKETPNISESHIWKDIKHAKYYHSLFSDNKDWTIEQLVMTTKPIVE